MAEYDLPIFVHILFTHNYLPFLKICRSRIRIILSHGNRAIRDPRILQLQWYGWQCQVYSGSSLAFRLIAHHCGGFIPFCQDRISLRDDDMRKFYSDTLLFIAAALCVAVIIFSVRSLVVWGTEYTLVVPMVIASENLYGDWTIDIPNNEKEKIFERNASSVKAHDLINKILRTCSFQLSGYLYPEWHRARLTYLHRPNCLPVYLL